jgi:hypothetical protein
MDRIIRYLFFFLKKKAWDTLISNKKKIMPREVDPSTDGIVPPFLPLVYF